MTSSDLWNEDTAQHYDADTAGLMTPEVLGPTVEFLRRAADGGRALELAIGTGRVALPLVAAGVPVTGIELSPAMVRRLREKADEATLPVVLGDMAAATAPGAFSLVYLVYNSISNLRTQDEQVACFLNAARHLSPGGRFVLELGVPQLRRLPPGQLAAPFDVSDEHLGFDVYDLVDQGLESHHVWRHPDGSVRTGVGRFRYLWPSECDLMARLAGLELEQRVADWDGSPFTSDSPSHVSVWRKSA